ncbi:MAG: hypothetical protein Q9212_001986 [Teloschistes hypoglaucus]
MASMQSTSQLFWRAVFEDPKFFESIKNHSRYRLRLIAIVSVDLGLFLNILSVCLARNKVLNGLAFLPLDPVCPDCHKHWKTPSGSDETYSLIHDEDDIESHAGTATELSEGEATARVQRQQTES